jgi:hypothetical protein
MDHSTPKPMWAPKHKVDAMPAAACHPVAKHLTRMARLLCLAACAASGAAPSAAQIVYRCGPTAGVTYSQTPCAGGRPINVGDPRSAMQQTEAQEVATKNELLGNAMAQDRREAEAAIRPALAGSLSAPRHESDADADARASTRAPKSKHATTSRPTSGRATRLKKPGVLFGVPAAGPSGRALATRR